MASSEEYESYIETMQVMREFPDLKREIQEAQLQYASGDYVTLEELIKDFFIS